MANIIPDLIICAIFFISCFVIHLFSNVFRLNLNAIINENNDNTIAQFVNKETSYGWFLKLLINCLGYSFVILPAFLIYKYTKKINYFERCEQTFIYNAIKLCIKGSTSNSNEKYENVTKSPVTSKTTLTSEIVLLIYCFVGLMGFYLTWGLLQEKIMTQDYEDSEGNRSKFTDSQFLVFVNRFLAFIISGIYLLLKSDVRHRSPLYKYSYASLSNILSAWFQYEALKFVSFPTQVLAKSCKIIPVMLMGKLISRNKYEHYEYLTATMISMGMIFFMFGSSDSHGSSSVTTMTGIFLLTMYMISDSFTSNWQNDLFKTYSMSSIQMMCGVSLFSTIFTASSLSVQGGLMEPLNFASQHPKFVGDCIILSICSAIGQLFIYFTIATFGSVTFTIIMTARQAIAILLSCLMYQHAISFLGKIGIVIVFLAIFVRIYCNQKIRKIRKIKNEDSKSKLPV